MNGKKIMNNKTKTFMPLLSGIIIALAVIFFGSGNAWAADVSDQTGLEAALSGTDPVITLTGGITLTGDITVSRAVTLSGGSITLDTVGYSLIVASGGNLTIDGNLIITGSGEQTIKVQNAGIFTLSRGNVISASGTIWHSAIYIEDGGTVNINGGAVVSNDDRSEGALYANGGTVSVNVSAGEITGYSHGIKLFYSDSTSDRSTVTVSGGTIAAISTSNQTYGVRVEKGNVTIDGDVEISAHIPIAVNVGSLRVSDGTFDGDFSLNSCPTVISGGTINGTISIFDSSEVTVTGETILGGANLDNCDTVEISGGTFAQGISVSGCGDTAISGGTFSGSVGVRIYGVDSGKSVSISGDAQITGTTYGVYGESCTFTIGDDVTVSGPYGLYLGDSCTAVINGGTITGNSYGSIFVNGGAVSLTGGTIINSRDEAGYYGIYLQSGPANNRITAAESLAINANAPLLYKDSTCFGSIPGPQTMAVGETKTVALHGFDISKFVYTVDTTNTSAELTASGTNQFSLIPTASGSYQLVISGRRSGESAFLTLTIPVSVGYCVTYDGNGGTGAAPAKIYKDASETFTAAADVSFTAPSGKQFGEWNTLADGTGTPYPAGATVTMPADNLTLYAIWEDIPVTYTVTFNSNGSMYAAKTAAGGESIGSTAWPDDPVRSSYTFGGWFTGENGTGDPFTSSTPVNNTITVYAQWTYSGGGSSGGSSPAAQTYNAVIKAENGIETSISVTVDKEAATASLNLGSQRIDQGGAVITIPSIPGVNNYSIAIQVPALSMTGEKATLTLNTDEGSVIIPSNMLTDASGISGSKAEISIGQGDKSGLPDDVKAAIGDRPVLRLTLSIDGKQTDWSNPDAPVTVTIPYTPTATELANPESIVIWYIDGSGNVVTIPNGHYDGVTGMVTFNTTHFSDYAVVYHPVSFSDVAAGAWYHDAVSFIAARRITDGTGKGKYHPQSKLTRGEFIVLMMRAYGIEPDANLTDNFSDGGNDYYTGYLATAKRLGLSAGVGNNLYVPDKKITRQEMFTLLYNALKASGQLPGSDSGKVLSDYADAGKIDAWAKESMSLLVKAGIVGGNNGVLSPLNTTTRAEMAQVLFNLLGE